VDGSLTWSGAAGAHRVRLSDDEYEAQEKTIEAEAGLTSRVRFELRHAKASSGQTAIQNSGGGLLTWVLVGVLGIAVAAVAVVAVHVVRSSGPRRVTTRRIDRYEVREQIGRGGMATIYKGLDTTRRGAAPVAIKVMDDSHLTDPDLVHKFLREGEILKQLNEADPEAPLVRVLHYGRAGGDSGRPFIAMELVEGEDLLKHLRRRGRLPQKEAARIVAGVARALVPAHAAGVYHRDLTPDNVILTSQPRGGYALRLIDFGVARHEYTSHGTLDGSIAGKPPFMSPEQCQAIPVDGRSDIYSLGVMLYALLAGAPPFVNRNPLEVMRMHKEEPVSFPADFPPSARVILEKALAKDRNKRQRDISALFSELSLLERLG
jgi:serine/threonine-protein kinase